MNVRLVVYTTNKQTPTTTATTKRSTISVLNIAKQIITGDSHFFAETCAVNDNKHIAAATHTR